MKVTAMGEQTTLSDRKRRAGQRLIVGIGGLTPTPVERRFAQEARPAGFILFKHNVEEPAQVRELNRELQGFLPDSLPPLLSVDQEGGRVQRIRVTEWPPARWLGNVDDLDLTRKLGRAMGDELRAMGFNLDFAPVADVDSNPRNPVIGDRSFGSDPKRVARHMRAWAAGLHDAGVIGCVKHFPGHGDTHQDSHKELPVVEKERPDLEQCELLPFRQAIAGGIGMVMSAHVVYPAWDEHNPATLSARILQGVLREDLGFGGVLISDDMEMGAVRGRMPLDMQLDLGCRASLDLFIFSHELPFAVEAWETLVRLQEDDATHDRLAIDSNRRLLALRRRFMLETAAAPLLSVVGSMEHRMLVADVNARGRA